MGRFEFRKNVIQLDIEGKMYEMPGDMEFLKTVVACCNKMSARAEELKDGEKDLSQATDFMLDTLEEILGAEAVDSIFAEREPDFYDCSDLCIFITAEIEKYHAKKLDAITPAGKEPEVIAEVHQNRAARRAAERRKNRK
jgi:hypothetical protein